MSRSWIIIPGWCLDLIDQNPSQEIWLSDNRPHKATSPLSEANYQDVDRPDVTKLHPSWHMEEVSASNSASKLAGEDAGHLGALEISQFTSQTKHRFVQPFCAFSWNCRSLFANTSFVMQYCNFLSNRNSFSLPWTLIRFSTLNFFLLYARNVFILRCAWQRQCSMRHYCSYYADKIEIMVQFGEHITHLHISDIVTF